MPLAGLLIKLVIPSFEHLPEIALRLGLSTGCRATTNARSCHPCPLGGLLLGPSGLGSLALLQRNYNVLVIIASDAVSTLQILLRDTLLSLLGPHVQDVGHISSYILEEFMSFGE